MTTPVRLEDRRRFVRLAHDPATLLPTSHFTRELGADHLLELAANEFLDQDVNKFADLARTTRPAGILSQATGGDLWQSPRPGDPGHRPGSRRRA